MRTPIPCLATLTVVALFAGRAAADDDGFKPLFNGKDMTGWKTHLDPKAKDADAAKTWTVKDGAIVCSGKPSGYFYTDKSYTNYVLRYDWRYPEGSPPSSNSGCLVHITGEPAIWPQSVEPQGRYQDHGKIFLIKVKALGENKFDVEAQKKANRPMGQWSTTEVTAAADGTVTVKLNGTEVASCKTPLKEGPIGYQSEGAEIHFKNIKIKEMK